MHPVPQLQLSGTPREIGYQHGQLAATQIQNFLALYRKYFKEQAGLEWDQVRELANEFAIHIAKDHDDLLDEMKGIAEGAGQEWIDIVALNVRSEIGLASPMAKEMKPIDGCTAFSWRDKDGTLWSAQNWDWKSSAASSLIALDILAHEPTKRPRIKMMTEAGVIGKIGVNEHGVSVLLNALKTELRDPSKIPIHLLLRRLISLPSIESCRAYLASPPISHHCASAAHILVTSPIASVSLEILPTGSFTRSISATLPYAAEGEGEEEGRIRKNYLTHTNHLRYKTEPSETHLWPDSFPRLSTLESLLESIALEEQEEGEGMSFEKIRTILSDRSLGEKGICRHENEKNGDIVTVFSIGIRNAREMKDVKARVIVGRPDEGGEMIEFDF
ncbi:uncharacterized protein JCM6883_001494 [Sporobolomyces salmoneus]|uniref:uncharacterized protein n=1 Tax=Sporobolomyces salmoneus TaxID=183962 RepID=UPI0031811745